MCGLRIYCEQELSADLSFWYSGTCEEPPAPTPDVDANILFRFCMAAYHRYWYSLCTLPLFLLGCLSIELIPYVSSFQRVLADSGNFLWISLSAAIICLVSLLLVMVFVRWTSTSFEDEIASTFTLLHRVLSSALSPILRDNLELSAGQDGYRVLHAELLKRSIKLNESYSQAAFELRIGRLSCE